MIEIEKKDYESVLSEIISTRDFRQLIEKCISNRHHYRSIVFDISRGSKSRNYKIIKEVSKSKKISDSFIIDQAKSVVSYFTSGKEDKFEDYYKTLQCPQGADEDQIRTSWIRLMKLYHPDKIGESGLEKSKKINEAYNILIDPDKREQYDRNYYPYIPIKIKNMDYKQFNNRSFIAVIASVLLIVPVFYISKNIINTDNGLQQDINIGKEKVKKESQITAKLFAPVQDGSVKQADKLEHNEEYKDTNDKGPANKRILSESADKSEEMQIGVEEDLEPKHVKLGNESDNYKIDADESLEKIAQYKYIEPSIGEDIAMVEIGEDLERLPPSHKEKKSIEDTSSSESINEKQGFKFPINYKVQKGDSLWSLSNKFNISVQDIKRQNSINRNKIKPGDILVLEKSKDGMSENNIVAKELPIEGKEKKEITNFQQKKQTKNSDQNKPKPWISGKTLERTNKTNDLSEKELLELASIGNNNSKFPDKSSVYTAISDYIFAYKNRDIKKLGALFDPKAVENGVSMNKVFKMYKKNFEILDIVAYDIKFNQVKLNNNNATVDGDFIISYNNIKEDLFKKSYGDINWKLTWNEKNWLINEIKYNVRSTKVGDESSRYKH